MATYGSVTTLFISNGNPLFATAWVRKILIAVVVSVPRS